MSSANYAAIFEQRSSPPWEARHGITSDQYQQTFNQLVGQGYRPVLVDGYGVNSQDFYAAIFEQRSSPPWEAHHRMTSDQYQQTFNRLVGQGYRPVNVSGYGVNGQALYAAIFEQSGGPPLEARHGLTSDQYQQTFNQLVGQGYRLVLVDGYGVNGQDFYAAIFEQRSSPPWEAHHRMTSDQYQQTFNRLVGQGYRPVNVSGYGVNGQALYAAIFEQSGGPALEARHGLTSNQYQQTFNQLVGQGYRPVDVSGYEV